LDFQISPVLTTATVNGVQKNVVIGSGKTGYVIALNLQDWGTVRLSGKNQDVRSRHWYSFCDYL
jgi:hypothetical protein